MTRAVFYQLPSWVSTTSGSTTASYWAVDPTTLVPPYDTSKLITNDISKNVHAYNLGSISFAQITTDDPPIYSGSTTIGPTWPGGTNTAAIGLEMGVYNALSASIKPPRVPAGGSGHDYEYTTVQYVGGTLSNRRFLGFYVEIISVSHNNARCKVWAAGTGNGGGSPAGTWWFDLSTQAMPIEPGYTVVGVGTGDPRTGALFLDSAAYGGVGLGFAKNPPSLGGSFEPR